MSLLEERAAANLAALKAIAHEEAVREHAKALHVQVVAEFVDVSRETIERLVACAFKHAEAFVSEVERRAAALPKSEGM